jgi:transforming growth factor-beta-induced protein
VGQILATNGRFSTFNTAFELANLDEALGDPGPFTLFAPTNEAFAKLPPGLLDTLRADPKGDLSDLVLRHVVNGRLPAATLGTLTAVTSVYGDPIAIQHTDSNQLLLNDAILIVGEEIPAFNGFVYAIDIVLLPDIAELLPLLPQFTQLTEALQGASLMDMLHGVGPFTLFAPTDAAWAVLSAETLASSDGVGQLLQSHLAGQRLLPPALATADLVPTLGGGEIVVTNAGGSLRLNGAAQLTGVMVQASNGVVLGIDALLVSPPALTDS